MGVNPSTPKAKALKKRQRKIVAIYHFSVKTISRSAGRSAVACAAYRSGEKLIDERYGKEQDYTRKSGVDFKNIYAPIYTKRSLTNRQTLWNEVEKAERRKDANLAREFEIAFPHELNQRQREKLLDELCCKIVERHGVVVDAVIHAPHTTSGSDERNYHAHIMFTSRHIDQETGSFSTKKNRDFNKEQSSETVKQWRSDFADLCNKYLEQANSLERVDHRSYQAQGLDLEPTQHEGSKVTQLRRQGIDTEISLSNDLIRARNIEKLANKQIIKGLDQEILFTERTLAKLELDQAHSKLEPKQEVAKQPQPIIKKATENDARNAIAKYKTVIEETAHKIFKEQYTQQVEDAKKWLEKINEMRSNTPMFIGKKAHLEKIDQEVALYENMRSNFLKFKELGVTNEHRVAAIQTIERTRPTLTLNAKNSEKFLMQRQLDQAKEQLDPNISILAQRNTSYHGKILQSGTQGTVQSTKDGLVYHPHVKDLKTGKDHTITYTETHVRIHESIEIKSRSGKSRENGLER